MQLVALVMFATADLCILGMVVIYNYKNNFCTTDVLITWRETHEVAVAVAGLQLYIYVAITAADTSACVDKRVDF